MTIVNRERALARTSERQAVSTFGVAVIGMGYVGLPTALAFAEAGARVTGIDVSVDRLEAIRARRVDAIPADHIRLERALAADELALTCEPGAIGRADAVVICVPTPVDAHRNPDLEPLSRACQTVVANARPGQTLILTSTTYVGTTRELLVDPLRRRGFEIGRDVFVAFSPERIDPGNANHQHQFVPRVIGGSTEECTARAAAVLGDVYASLHAVSSPETAEMTKLYENLFRAVNIALANEIADVAHALDVDTGELIAAAATKPYGFMPFYPGPGVGGHCIPCDPHYLRWQLRALHEDSPLLDQAMDCIGRRPRHVTRRVLEFLGDRGVAPRNARVLVYGVAYKPMVGDVRESPAIEIIDELREKGVEVEYYDELVPKLRLAAGDSSSRTDPDGNWDVVLAHTVHTQRDAEWLTRCRAVLDTSFRLPHHDGLETI